MPLILRISRAFNFQAIPDARSAFDWMIQHWRDTPQQEYYYRSKGVDGSYCGMLTFLNLEGFYCPEAADLVKPKIRGVNLGGWLVLEPWITPSLFEQFKPEDGVMDQWAFCAKLGPEEARAQLQKHWDTWVTEDDIRTLSESGITHVRIPIG